MVVIITVLAVFIVGLLLYGYGSNYMLKIEHYEIGAGQGDREGKGERKSESEELRIVMLTDLHANTFGTKNSRLLRAVREQKPNMICIAGDMTVKNGKGMDSCLALCKELVSLCPVYYAPGNHEIRMAEYPEYIDRLKKAGVVWLGNSSSFLFFKNRKIGIYGLDIGEEFYHKFWQKREFGAENMKMLLGAAGTEEVRILLAHDPEYFPAYREWGADLVLSGHVHGGIAKLPLLGGVIDPALRLFPKYDAGLFRENGAYMVLSRGLGTHHIRLRFFNPPEVSVIHLTEINVE